MCGIWGIAKFDGSGVDPELLISMGKSLVHRGPDDDGAVLLSTDNKKRNKRPYMELQTLSETDPRSSHSPYYSIGLGHCRLSIIDLTPAAHQPMADQTQTRWIVYNGEIYNYREIRRRLLSRGHRFKSQSDTEVILASYKKWGTDCVAKFNGIFAFALWDNQERHLFLARDHFGVKPLYYYQDDRCFVFGSEIKAFLCLPWINRELDMKALDLLLTFRHTPSPYTLLKGIYKLPPGHGMIVSQEGECETWDFRDPIPPMEKGKGEKQWSEEIRAAFLDAGQRQMVSDVPIALSLSSGIDSGALLAAMDRSNNHAVDCFTVGFDGGEKINEAEEARVTASHFHSRFHYKQIRSSDYVKFFQKYIWHLEEPIENASSAAYYFVAKMARDAGIKVLFNGQGADEVFGGYPRYFGEKFASLYKHLPPLFRRSIIRPVVDFLPRSERLKRSVYSLGEEDELRRFLKIYTITPAQWKMRLIRNFGWSHEMIHEQEALSYLEKELRLIPSGDSLWRMLCLDVRTQLADNLLLCEDKMSMAASVEARVPFLDREFMDLAYRIPSSLKIRGLTTKYILRRSLESLLPPEIIRRPKRGFPNPMEVWIRKELGYLIKDFFGDTDSLANTIFNRTFLQHVLDQHERGRQDYKRFLFLYVCLELWAMAFLRAKS